MKQLKGELVRAIDLPALVHDKYKSFELLPAGYSNARKLAEDIEAECLKNYGVALRRFVKYVAWDVATIRARIAAEMQRFFKGAGVPEHGWEHRFAKRFALAYAAAKLAIEYGVVPWNDKMVAHAIKACYLAARAAVPDADKLRADGFARLRSQLSGAAIILDLVRSGHKVQWTAEQAQAAEALRHPGPGGAYFLVRPKTFVSWFESTGRSSRRCQRAPGKGREAAWNQAPPIPHACRRLHEDTRDRRLRQVAGKETSLCTGAAADAGRRALAISINPRRRRPRPKARLREEEVQMLNPTQTQAIVAAGRTITIATRGDPALGPLTRHSPDFSRFRSQDRAVDRPRQRKPPFSRAEGD